MPYNREKSDRGDSPMKRRGGMRRRKKSSVSIVQIRMLSLIIKM